MATRVTDILIVGGGIAGLCAALGARNKDVLVVNAEDVGEGGSSALALGGIAAAVGPGDSPQLHRDDTQTAGAGLCDPNVVRILTEAGPGVVELLLALGVPFDRDEDAYLSPGREAAHSCHRILHVDGDATGRAIVDALVEAVQRMPNKPELWRGRVASLIELNDRVMGAVVERPDGTLEPVFARATILATGGVGALYGRTSNPPNSRGDGIALASNVGAALRDLEFVQFHPTGLDSPRRPMCLLTEALRGAGATLVDATGTRIMKTVHPDAELAPRDIVARAVYRERWLGHGVYLDLGPLGSRFAKNFPSAEQARIEAGWSRRERLPVCPVAHYHMGGVATDTHGRTTVDGLWAVGEVACTGAHGANRLASNSVLEALVFGLRAGRDAAQTCGSACIGELATAWDDLDRVCDHRLDPELDDTMERIADMLWERVGVIREKDGLEEALEMVRTLQANLGTGALYARYAVRVAGLITAAALERTESRGAHFRADFPEPRPGWQHSLIHREAGEFIARTNPGARAPVPRGYDHRP